MDKCIVPRSKTGELEPLILSTLASDRIAEVVDAKSLTNPLPVVSRAWSSVLSAMDEVLDELRGPDPTVPFLENQDAVLRAQRDLLYRVAEFTEAVEKQTAVLVQGYMPSRQLHRTLSEQCNAIKHEGARLGWVSAKDAIMRVHGYQLRHLNGRSEDPMDRFHKKRPSFSFNLELRRLMVHLYLLGDHAGRAVVDAHGPGKPRGIDYSIKVIGRINALSPVLFPGERQLGLPILSINAVGLTAATKGGRYVALNGAIEIKHLHEGDGITTTFGLANV